MRRAHRRSVVVQQRAAVVCHHVTVTNPATADEDARRLRRVAYAVMIWLGVATIYGAGTSWVPSPTDGSFWLSNASAPYLVLPFLAGTTVSRPWWATAALGVMVDWAMVGAFYARSLYDPAVLANNQRQGQDSFSPRHLFDWFVNLYTVSGRWMVLGVVAGLVFALLGRGWRTTRSPLLAVTAAAALAVEPLAHEIDASFGTMPATGWIAEIGGGACLLVVLLAWGARTDPRRSPRA